MSSIQKCNKHFTIALFIPLAERNHGLEHLTYYQKLFTPTAIYVTQCEVDIHRSEEEITDLYGFFRRIKENTS